MLVRLIGWMLKRNLSVEQRNALVVHILGSLGALPLRDIITVSDEGIFIRGKQIDMEQGAVLREAAQLALSNKALNLIREQVTYTAFVLGGIKAEDTKALLFARAALWWGQNEEMYLNLLAQNQPEVQRDY